MKDLFVTLGAVVLPFTLILTICTTFSPPAAKAGGKMKFAKFTKQAELIRPEGYREWIFVGTPLTPTT